jgi:hypothetical protein
VPPLRKWSRSTAGALSSESSVVVTSSGCSAPVDTRSRTAGDERTGVGAAHGEGRIARVHDQAGNPHGPVQRPRAAADAVGGGAGQGQLMPGRVRADVGHQRGGRAAAQRWSAGGRRTHWPNRYSGTRSRVITSIPDLIITGQAGNKSACRVRRQAIASTRVPAAHAATAGPASILSFRITLGRKVAISNSDDNTRGNGRTGNLIGRMTGNLGGNLTVPGLALGPRAR